MQKEKEKEAELSKKGKCYIVDISPNGARILSDLLMDIKQLKKIELSFVLDEKPITIIGDLIWSQKKVSGYEYGVQFHGNQETEQLIVNELKARRKKEISRVH
jgi:hypothetical protein